MVRFTPQFLDELRARLSVSEVVGKRVKLKKAGREWKGLSPFNKERTPSFFVNDSKGMWFDFSSGRNGNIFDFLMATEGLSFPEAVEAGLAVERIGTSSVTYRIGIFRAGAEQASADGRFVHVYVDRATRRPVPIPDDVRAVLAPLA